MDKPAIDSRGAIPSFGSGRRSLSYLWSRHTGGARLALDPDVPIQARKPVRYRLDVHLPDAAATGASTKAGTSRPATPGTGADDRAPWWKSPGGIIGLVAVQGAVLAVILMNNDDETPASPSSP